MTNDQLDIVVHLLVATLAGGVIGLERSYHGRPAGFRTHTLVCVASSLLMFVTLYQASWYNAVAPETVNVDPTRMAQGIMTGIGFLGAGVILREGLSVRGLTTAASIWITAAIGILAGIGLYFATAVATALAIGILTAFRWIEAQLPTQLHAQLDLRFRREAALPESDVRALAARHGFTIANLTYELEPGSEFFAYRMVIRSNNRNAATALAASLDKTPALAGYRIAPTGD